MQHFYERVLVAALLKKPQLDSLGLRVPQFINKLCIYKQALWLGSTFGKRIPI